VRFEDFFGGVEQEPEGQKDFHVGPLLKDPLVDLLGILQLIYTHSVGSVSIANGIERVQNLKEKNEFEKMPVNK